MRTRVATVLAWVLWLAPAAPSGQSPADLATLLRRMAAYLADYETALSSVVAEEQYTQTVHYYDTYPRGQRISPTNQWTRRRRLVSDYLLVKVPGLIGWQPFRDVIEVDGEAVGDRETRLADLFIARSANVFDQATRIAGESARYNIGGVSRTINVPTLALVFVGPVNSYRFDFTRESGRRIDGVDTVGVGYSERQRPTLIRTAGDNDLAASGLVFIEPETGRVSQTVLRTSDGTLESEITVTFRPDQRLGIWVPASMKELYRTAAERIEGTARYAKFRRFKVETLETIK